MAQSTLAYVGLGSNLGDREGTLRQAVQHLDDGADVRVLRISELCESRALGDASQPDYLNGVVEVETTLPVRRFFQHLMDIEQRLGRVRSDPGAARTIDLDLLLFGNASVSEPDLQVPHTQMILREFVLRPLAELVPQRCLPGHAEPVCDLAARLQGRSYTYPEKRPFVIAIAGNIGAGKTTLTNCLGPELGAEVLHEPYKSNPFLPQVYAGVQDLALDSQLYFLANRADQLSERTLVPDRVYVADYIFEKERVYASLLLQGAQLDLYERLYPHLVRQIVPPSLVIHLEYEIEGCLERIRRRGRQYEQSIQADFLHALNQAYEALLGDWSLCPVIRLCVEDFDCLRAEHVTTLVRQVQAYMSAARMGNDPPGKEPIHAHS